MPRNDKKRSKANRVSQQEVDWKEYRTDLPKDYPKGMFGLYSSDFSKDPLLKEKIELGKELGTAYTEPPTTGSRKLTPDVLEDQQRVLGESIFRGYTAWAKKKDVATTDPLHQYIGANYFAGGATDPGTMGTFLTKTANVTGAPRQAALDYAAKVSAQERPVSSFYLGDDARKARERILGHYATQAFTTPLLKNAGELGEDAFGIAALAHAQGAHQVFRWDADKGSMALKTSYQTFGSSVRGAFRVEKQKIREERKLELNASGMGGDSEEGDGLLNSLDINSITGQVVNGEFLNKNDAQDSLDNISAGSATIDQTGMKTPEVELWIKYDADYHGGDGKTVPKIDDVKNWIETAQNDRSKLKGFKYDRQNETLKDIAPRAQAEKGMPPSSLALLLSESNGGMDALTKRTETVIAGKSKSDNPLFNKNSPVRSQGWNSFLDVRKLYGENNSVDSAFEVSHFPDRARESTTYTRDTEYDEVAQQVAGPGYIAVKGSYKSLNQQSGSTMFYPFRGLKNDLHAERSIVHNKDLTQLEDEGDSFQTKQGNTSFNFNTLTQLEDRDDSFRGEAVPDGFVDVPQRASQSEIASVRTSEFDNASKSAFYGSYTDEQLANVPISAMDSEDDERGWANDIPEQPGGTRGEEAVDSEMASVSAAAKRRSTLGHKWAANYAYPITSRLAPGTPLVARPKREQDLEEQIPEMTDDRKVSLMADVEKIKGIQEKRRDNKKSIAQRNKYVRGIQSTWSAEKEEQLPQLPGLHQERKRLERREEKVKEEFFKTWGVEADPLIKKLDDKQKRAKRNLRRADTAADNETRWFDKPRDKPNGDEAMPWLKDADTSSVGTSFSETAAPVATSPQPISDPARLLAAPQPAQREWWDIDRQYVTKEHAPKRNPDADALKTSARSPGFYGGYPADSTIKGKQSASDTPDHAERPVISLHAHSQSTYDAMPKQTDPARLLAATSSAPPKRGGLNTLPTSPDAIALQPSAEFRVFSDSEIAAQPKNHVDPMENIWAAAQRIMPDESWISSYEETLAHEAGHGVFELSHGNGIGSFFATSHDGGQVSAAVNKESYLGSDLLDTYVGGVVGASAASYPLKSRGAIVDIFQFSSLTDGVKSYDELTQNHANEFYKYAQKTSLRFNKELHAQTGDALHKTGPFIYEADSFLDLGNEFDNGIARSVRFDYLDLTDGVIHNHYEDPGTPLPLRKTTSDGRFDPQYEPGYDPKSAEWRAGDPLSGFAKITPPPPEPIGDPLSGNAVIVPPPVPPGDELSGFAAASTLPPVPAQEASTPAQPKRLFVTGNKYETDKEGVGYRNTPIAQRALKALDHAQSAGYEVHTGDDQRGIDPLVIDEAAKRKMPINTHGLGEHPAYRGGGYDASTKTYKSGGAYTQHQSDEKRPRAAENDRDRQVIDSLGADDRALMLWNGKSPDVKGAFNHAEAQGVTASLFNAETGKTTQSEQKPDYLLPARLLNEQGAMPKNSFAEADSKVQQATMNRLFGKKRVGIDSYEQVLAHEAGHAAVVLGRGGAVNAGAVSTSGGGVILQEPGDKPLSKGDLLDRFTGGAAGEAMFTGQVAPNVTHISDMFSFASVAFGIVHPDELTEDHAREFYGHAQGLSERLDPATVKTVANTLDQMGVFDGSKSHWAQSLANIAGVPLRAVRGALRMTKGVIHHEGEAPGTPLDTKAPSIKDRTRYGTGYNPEDAKWRNDTAPDFSLPTDGSSVGVPSGSASVPPEPKRTAVHNEESMQRLFQRLYNGQTEPISAESLLTHESGHALMLLHSGVEVEGTQVVGNGGFVQSGYYPEGISEAQKDDIDVAGAAAQSLAAGKPFRNFGHYMDLFDFTSRREGITSLDELTPEHADIFYAHADDLAKRMDFEALKTVTNKMDELGNFTAGEVPRSRREEREHRASVDNWNFYKKHGRPKRSWSIAHAVRRLLHIKEPTVKRPEYYGPITVTGGALRHVNHELGTPLRENNHPAQARQSADADWREQNGDAFIPTAAEPYPSAEKYPQDVSGQPVQDVDTPSAPTAQPAQITTAIPAHQPNPIVNGSARSAKQTRTSFANQLAVLDKETLAQSSPVATVTTQMQGDELSGLTQASTHPPAPATVQGDELSGLMPASTRAPGAQPANSHTAATQTLAKTGVISPPTQTGSGNGGSKPPSQPPTATLPDDWPDDLDPSLYDSAAAQSGPLSAQEDYETHAPRRLSQSNYGEDYKQELRKRFVDARKAARASGGDIDNNHPLAVALKDATSDDVLDTMQPIKPAREQAQNTFNGIAADTMPVPSRIRIGAGTAPAARGRQDQADLPSELKRASLTLAGDVMPAKGVTAQGEELLAAHSIASAALSEGAQSERPTTGSVTQQIAGLLKASETALRRHVDKMVGEIDKNDPEFNQKREVAKRVADAAFKLLTNSVDQISGDVGGENAPRTGALRAHSRENYHEISANKEGKDTLTGLTSNSSYYQERIAKLGGIERAMQNQFIIPGREGAVEGDADHLGIAFGGPRNVNNSGGRGFEMLYAARAIRSAFQGTIGEVEQGIQRYASEDRGFSIGSGNGFGERAQNQSKRKDLQFNMDRADADNFDYLTTTPARILGGNRGAADVAAFARLGGGAVLAGQVPQMLGIGEQPGVPMGTKGLGGALGGTIGSQAAGVGVLAGAAMVGTGLGVAVANTIPYVGKAYGGHFGLEDAVNTAERGVFAASATINGLFGDTSWAKNTFAAGVYNEESWAVGKSQTTVDKQIDAAKRFVYDNHLRGISPDGKTDALYIATQSIGIKASTGGDPLAMANQELAVTTRYEDALTAAQPQPNHDGAHPLFWGGNATQPAKALTNDEVKAAVQADPKYIAEIAALKQSPAYKLNRTAEEYQANLGALTAAGIIQDANDTHVQSASSRYAQQMGFVAGTQSYEDTLKDYTTAPLGADGKPSVADFLIQSNAKSAYGARMGNATNALTGAGVDPLAINGMIGNTNPLTASAGANLLASAGAAGADVASGDIDGGPAKHGFDENGTSQDLLNAINGSAKEGKQKRANRLNAIGQQLGSARSGQVGGSLSTIALAGGDVSQAAEDALTMSAGQYGVYSADISAAMEAGVSGPDAQKSAAKFAPGQTPHLGNVIVNNAQRAQDLGMGYEQAKGLFTGLSVQEQSRTSSVLSMQADFGLNVNRGDVQAQAVAFGQNYTNQQLGAATGQINTLVGLGARSDDAISQVAKVGPLTNYGNRIMSRLQGGDSYTTSQFARTEYGKSLGAVETENALGQPIHQAESWAQEAQSHALGYGETRYQLGIQAQRTQQQGAFSLGGSFYNPMSGQQDYVGGGGSIGLAESQAKLGWAQTSYGFDFQQRQMGVQRSQFYETQGFNAKVSAQENTWNKRDWSFSEDQSQLHFGWAMQDADRNIKYARGRDRQDLIRNKERAVVDETMRESHSQDEKGRIDTKRTWELESQERAKRFFEQDQTMQQERLRVDRQFFEQGKQYEIQRLEMQRKEAELSQFYAVKENEHATQLAVKQEGLYQAQLKLSHQVTLEQEAAALWYSVTYPKLLAANQVDQKRVIDAMGIELQTTLTNTTSQADTFIQNFAVTFQNAMSPLIQTLFNQANAPTVSSPGGVGSNRTDPGTGDPPSNPHHNHGGAQGASTASTADTKAHQLLTSINTHLSNIASKPATSATIYTNDVKSALSAFKEYDRSFK